MKDAVSFGAADVTPFGEHFNFERDGIAHTVFTKGDGPGVLLMHELPGMMPEFWRLANWLSQHFTVWAPDMFGNGTKHTPAKPKLLTLRACISREIHLFADNDPGPITQWLRALAQELHQTVGGRGIGTIGMCMTGNFSLTLALDPWVTAPVVSQPGLPGSGPFKNRDGGLQLNQKEKDVLAQRDVDVFGLRFEGDKFCKAARFDAIRSVIGSERFQENVLPNSARNPRGPLKFPHSVLTTDLVDDKDSLTKQKLAEVVAFLKARV